MTDYTRNIVEQIKEKGEKLLKEGINGHCFTQVMSIDETVTFFYNGRSFVIECPEDEKDNFCVYEDVYSGSNDNIPVGVRPVKKMSTALKYMVTLTKR